MVKLEKIIFFLGCTSVRLFACIYRNTPAIFRMPLSILQLALILLTMPVALMSAGLFHVTAILVPLSGFMVIIGEFRFNDAAVVITLSLFFSVILSPALAFFSMSICRGMLTELFEEDQLILTSVRPGRPLRKWVNIFGLSTAAFFSSLVPWVGLRIWVSGHHAGNLICYFLISAAIVTFGMLCVSAHYLNFRRKNVNVTPSLYSEEKDFQRMEALSPSSAITAV